jgi:hypothetical protein
LESEIKDNTHLKNLDKTCTLNMYDFIKENNKNIQLFQSRHHPKTYFIMNMAIKLLDYLNIEYNDEYDYEYNNNINNNISDADEYCVLKVVSNILNLKYNTEDYIVNKYSSLVYYYILLSKFSNKIKNILLKENLIGNDEFNQFSVKIIIHNEKVRKFMINHLDKLIKSH